MSGLAKEIVAAIAADGEALAELRELLGTGLQQVERLLKSDEAADLLGIARSTITRLSRQGRILGAVWNGSEWRYRPSELAMLPPEPVSITAATGRGHRPAHSTTVDAIRGKAA